MREIKFRFWNKKHGGMDCHALDAMFDCECGGFDQTKYSIMQFTGLKDKTGKEIYEGDILHDCEVEHGADYIVKFEPAFFAGYDTNTKRKMYLHGFRFCKCIIIGNVYENPELINTDAKSEEAVAQQPTAPGHHAE